jgi:hypothetical protein
MQELTAFREDMHPKDFWAALQVAGYDLRRAACGVAESHKEAAEFFMNARIRKNVRILHVDAHHDLGYTGMKALNKNVRDAHVDASNWLGVYLRLFPYTKADLVFPSWNPQAIEDALSQAPMTVGVKKRVTMRQWPAVPVAPEFSEVTQVFVCRSGSWAPPWHDQAFEQFISDLNNRTTRPIEYLDARPLSPRAWNAEAVHLRAEDLRDNLNVQIAYIGETR